MKYRLRFETLAQLEAFRTALKADPENYSSGSGDSANSYEYILPIGELEKKPELLNGGGEGLEGSCPGFVIVEIPAVIWPSMEDRTIGRLQALKDKGLKAAVAENIGAIAICRELGLECCGGYGLNILNSEAIEQYRLMGLKDALLSFELGFPAMRKMASDRRKAAGGLSGSESVLQSVPIGFIGYGYLPLMKFRACPMKGEKGCGSCSGFNYLTDRTDTRFPLICRDRQYSELLNHLPVYVADKGAPELDFECLYFTIERPDAVAIIVSSYVHFESPAFLRTAGLYQRKLL
ncbi:MAG: hypothetical protein IJM08_03450 [Firmicutes bacterium]|nr:hypothetical protein [Bacillota bacterium]